MPAGTFLFSSVRNCGIVADVSALCAWLGADDPLFSSMCFFGVVAVFSLCTCSGEGGRRFFIGDSNGAHLVGARLREESGGAFFLSSGW